MLFSANRFKNLCPEYVAEAVAQQNLAAAKAEAEKQNMDKFNVQQTTSPGKEGADDPAPNASHVVSPTDQQQEAADADAAEPIDVSITATDAKSGDNAGPVNVTVTANEDIPGRKVEEAADVSEPEEVDFVSEAAYIDYLLESLDETEE